MKDPYRKHFSLLNSFLHKRSCAPVAQASYYHAILVATLVWIDPCASVKVAVTVAPKSRLVLTELVPVLEVATAPDDDDVELVVAVVERDGMRGGISGGAIVGFGTGSIENAAVVLEEVSFCCGPSNLSTALANPGWQN